MTVPLWCLLTFAAWTLLTLSLTVGSYRWSRILTGRAGFRDYARPETEATGWYPRAMRAHANCVENLPVFGAIVLCTWAAGVRSPALDALAVVVVAARIPHTIVHVAFDQTERAVFARSMLFNTQFAAMTAMIVVLAVRLLGS